MEMVSSTSLTSCASCDRSTTSRSTTAKTGRTAWWRTASIRTRKWTSSGSSSTAACPRPGEPLGGERLLFARGSGPVPGVLQQRHAQDRENRLVENGFYSHEEVDQFREFFNSGMPNRIVVSLPEVAQMIGAFVPLQMRQLMELGELFREVIRTSEGAGHINR